jgi:hypothetical protein
MKTQDTKFNFTKKIVESLPKPEIGKRAYYYDTKVRGLGGEIIDKATQTFIVYHKIGSRGYTFYQKTHLAKCLVLGGHFR